MNDANQHSPETPTDNSGPRRQGSMGLSSEEVCHRPNGNKRQTGRPRRDAGQLHRVRHGVLSREVLAALARLGEDPKTYRRLERKFRAALHPPPPWGDLFFDRFWSCYLRLMLVGRLEARLVEPEVDTNEDFSQLESLLPGERPTLALPEASDPSAEGDTLLGELPPDLLHQLVLAQRYDRHYSRELYRALAVLLLLRRGGMPALEAWATTILGAHGFATPNKGEMDA